jgi:hypothetical protein
LSVLKKPHRIKEHPTLTSAHGIDIVKSFITRTTRAPLVARAVSKFDILCRMRLEAAVVGQYKVVLASVCRQFLYDSVGLPESFFHDGFRVPASPLGQPTTESGRRYTINGRDKRKAGAVRRAAERVIDGFLAPTSTAILGSQPRQANQVMVLAVSLAGSDMTSHPRKGNPEEQECPSTWQ